MTEEAAPPEWEDEPLQARLYAALATLGIHTIRADYSGCGDSGCLENVRALDAARNPLDLPDTPVTLNATLSRFDTTTRSYRTVSEDRSLPLREAVEQWCYDLLDAEFPGWEIDDGSSGEITIDVDKRSGRIVHTFLEPSTITQEFS